MSQEAFEVGEPRHAGDCFDPDGEDVTITITQAPTKGTYRVDRQGRPFPSVEYTATTEGADTFKFQASDGQLTSPVVTVTTNNVAAVNDPPQCSAASGTFVVGQRAFAGECLDEEGDNLTITVTDPPSRGMVEVFGQGTPAPNVAYRASTGGADAFKFQASDGNSTSPVVTVTTNNVSPGGGGAGNAPGSGANSGGDCPTGTSAGVTCQALPGGGRKINGTPSDDVINCGAGNDVVDAGRGNDVINCGAGDDRIDGGSGNDLISGNEGNDRIGGGSGNDRANGNSGNDRVGGGPGNDRVGGQSGRDRLDGDRGRDRVSGGSGNDRLSGGSGNDRVAGDTGNDAISARDRQRDRVSCGRGRDRVSADRSDRVSRSCERVRRRR